MRAHHGNSAMVRENGQFDMFPSVTGVVKPSGIGDRPEDHEPKISSADIAGTPKRDIKHSAQTLDEV